MPEPAPATQPIADPLQLHKLMVAGDPSVPGTLRLWIDRETQTHDVGHGTPELRAALDSLMDVPLQATVPVLVRLFNDPTVDVTIRDRAPWWPPESWRPR